MHGALAYEVVAAALLAGMRGIGVKQHGPHSGRFIHLDDLRDGYPRPNLWSYP